MPWRGWKTAERYDAFVRSHGVYRWLNRELMARVDLEHAHRVLDLGCGTGATALAALGHMPLEADYVGVDASPEMLSVASANIVDFRCSFVRCWGTEVHRHVLGRFDRVLSNAAFWQLGHPPQVLTSVRRLCADDAIFVFNVPTARIYGEDAAPDPFQIALARAVERATGQSFEMVAERVEAEQLEGCGFTVDAVVERVYSTTQHELVALMALPSMISALLPTMSDERHHEVIADAASTVDMTAAVKVGWTFFTLRAQADETGEFTLPPT